MSENTLFKTFTNALLQRVKSFRGNWEQNDPTADDYIANRPFYTEDPVEIALVDNLTVESNEDWIWFELPQYFNLVLGEKYKVVVDGTEYMCEAYDDGDGYYIIGSYSIWCYGSFEENDFPFCCGDGWLGLPQHGSHTFSMFKYVVNDCKIDNKYISFPQSDWNEKDDTKETYIKNKTNWIEHTIEETTINYMYAPMFGLENDAAYLVTCDGAEYECVAYIPEDGYVCIGGDGEPFTIFDDYGYNEGCVFFEDNMEHTISVVRYHQIDPKLIPDSIARTSDIPSDYLTYDRMMAEFRYSTYNNIYWDKNSDGRESITVGGKTYYKISDKFCDYQNLDYLIANYSDGDVVNTKTDGSYWKTGTKCFRPTYAVIVVFEEGVPGDGCVFDGYTFYGTPGIYAYTNGVDYVSQIYIRYYIEFYTTASKFDKLKEQVGAIEDNVDAINNLQFGYTYDKELMQGHTYDSYITGVPYDNVYQWGQSVKIDVPPGEITFIYNDTFITVPDKPLQAGGIEYHSYGNQFLRNNTLADDGNDFLMLINDQKAVVYLRELPTSSWAIYTGFTFNVIPDHHIPDTIARVSDIETMIQTRLGVIENGTY